MGREYPRFLFSNPKNTKSKGPFVVHTLEPRFIARIDRVPQPSSKHYSTHNGKFIITFLDDETGYSQGLHEATDALFIWLDKQLSSKQIDF